jgi:hypothetical protein
MWSHPTIIKRPPVRLLNPFFPIARQKFSNDHCATPTLSNRFQGWIQFFAAFTRGSSMGLAISGYIMEPRWGSRTLAERTPLANPPAIVS